MKTVTRPSIDQLYLASSSIQRFTFNTWPDESKPTKLSNQDLFLCSTQAQLMGRNARLWASREWKGSNSCPDNLKLVFMSKSYLVTESLVFFFSASSENMEVIPSLESIDDWLLRKGMSAFPSASLGPPSEGKRPRARLFDGWPSEPDAVGLLLVKRKSNQCRRKNCYTLRQRGRESFQLYLHLRIVVGYLCLWLFQELWVWLLWFSFHWKALDECCCSSVVSEVLNLQGEKYWVLSECSC